VNLTLETLQPFVPYALAFLADGGAGSTYQSAKRELKDLVDRDPMDALVAAVVGGGFAYYLAEHETNVSCATPLEGILYASSALFGYDTSPPTTETGRAIASFVKTFGPALAGRAFDEPAGERIAREAEAAEVNRQILARLEDIVRLLEARA
jgi:hypothetical protein